jgi:hypothetical protein
MSYLKLNKKASDPFKNPDWVGYKENATSFSTQERADAANLRVPDAHIVYDQERKAWYIENNSPAPTAASST